jgi:HK97 gp10 family phage protein
MAMFTIKIEGIAELKKTFSQIDSELQAALKEALSAGAAVVVRDAKIRCPVDTGTLRRSLREIRKIGSPGRIESNVGTDIEYAPHVEYGTRYQASQPYLRPALDENTDEIQRAFDLKIKQVVARYK